MSEPKVNILMVDDEPANLLALCAPRWKSLVKIWSRQVPPRRRFVTSSTTTSR